MKLKLAKGMAWTTRNGQRISIEEIEAQSPDDCCRLDCCENKLLINAKSAADSTVLFPTEIEVINVAGVVKLRITVKTDSGNIVKEL